MTLDTVRVYGDTVIARCVFTGHARASDAEIAARMFVVYFFQNGLITRCEDFGDREEALKAAGVAE
jgi:ketosteroid isomerase-like protein